MKTVRTLRTLLLGALLLLGQATAGVALPHPNAAKCKISGFDVISFTVNQQLILEIYNSIDQSNNQITSWPANLNQNVIGVTVNNQGETARPFRFKLVIKDGSQAIATVKPLESMSALPVGMNSLSAASFRADGGAIQAQSTYNSEFWENELKGFQDNPTAAKGLLTRNFKICLVPLDDQGNDVSNGTDEPSSCEACTFLTLMAPAAGSDCNVPMIVWPHNNAIPTGLPVFVWTPAYSKDCPRNEITYQLEIMEGNANGQVVSRIDIPAGQTSYNYSPSDRVLTPGVKYFWRIIAKCKGQVFCGPSGRGWNIVKWFMFQATEEACNWTLEQVDNYIRDNAPSEIVTKLKDLRAAKMLDPTNKRDRLICDLLTGRIQPSQWTFK